MLQNQSIITQHLQYITKILLINGTLVECPGLLHGKMGISIFFFHYGRFSGNELFFDYAFDVISEIQEQIHNQSSADYERGIAGIGIGMDYLIKNGFLQTEEDIFDDFDQRMFRAVMYEPWQDFSLYEGLIGYGRYWIKRYSSSKQAKECLLHVVSRIEERIPDFSSKEQIDVYCFLHDLCQIQGFEMCANLLRKINDPSTDFIRLGKSIVGDMIRVYQQNHYFNGNVQDEIYPLLKQIPHLNMEKAPTDMGLLTGFAGEGMLRLTTIEPKNISWMNLM